MAKETHEMTAVQRFRQLVADVSKAHESHGMDVRIQLARELRRWLKKHDWSQADLSRESGIGQGEISEIMHADANVTIETIGRLLHALGARSNFYTVPASLVAAPEDKTDGEESKWFEPIREEAPEVRFAIRPADTASPGPIQFSAHLGGLNASHVSRGRIRRRVGFRHRLRGRAGVK